MPAPVLHPTPGTTRQLSCRRRGSTDDLADLVEGDGEDVVQHEGDPFGGREQVEHDEQGGPDRVGHERARASGSMSSATPRSARAGGRRPAPRAMTCATRSLSKQTRATIVVSHPAKFSTPFASARSTRSHVSWTASSASVMGAEHPVGHRPQMGPACLEPVGHPIGVRHWSHSLVAIRHSNDEPNPADVTTSRPQTPAS